MDFGNSLEKMIGLASGSNDPAAMRAVMDVQKELIQIQEENRRLRIENHGLKNIDITRSELKKRGNAYYKGEEGPYCTTCFDAEGKLIYLNVYLLPYNSYAKGKCGNCDSDVSTTITEEEYKNNYR